MSNPVHDRTTVYNTGYHIVWSVKYRKDVLTGKLEKSLKQILIDIAYEKNFITGEMEILNNKYPNRSQGRTTPFGKLRA